MDNPFDEIIKRLSKIELLLADYKPTAKEEQLLDEKITVKEAADLLRVSEQSIRSYIKKGTLEAKQIGRPYLIDRTIIEKAMVNIKSLKYKRT